MDLQTESNLTYSLLALGGRAPGRVGAFNRRRPDTAGPVVTLYLPGVARGRFGSAGTAGTTCISQWTRWRTPRSHAKKRRRAAIDFLMV